MVLEGQCCNSISQSHNRLKLSGQNGQLRLLVGRLVLLRIQHLCETGQEKNHEASERQIPNVNAGEMF